MRDRWTPRVTLTLLPEFAALFLIAFARVGTLVMLMPGIGDRLIPVRARLAFALLLTLVLLPLLRPVIRIDVNDQMALVGLLITEILIGLMLGAALRITVSAMQLAGTVVAQQIGLSVAATLDPATGGQNPSVATFLILLGTVMIFATDLHHLAIRGIAESYRLIAPGGSPSVGDAATFVTRTFASAFLVGVQIAAPFLVFGIVFNIGMGVLSRLVPQIQVFFLALPASILIGTLILIAAMGVMTAVFLAFLQGLLSQLVGA
jgi:flagellar biosynthesis protein FliR